MELTTPSPPTASWMSPLRPATESVWGSTPLAAPIDHNNDGVLGVDSSPTPPASPSLADKNDAYARQLMARHLYVLAWALIDQAPDALKPLIDPTKADTGGSLLLRCEAIGTAARSMGSQHGRFPRSRLD